MASKSPKIKSIFGYAVLSDGTEYTFDGECVDRITGRGTSESVQIDDFIRRAKKIGVKAMTDGGVSPEEANWHIIFTNRKKKSLYGVPSVTTWLKTYELPE